MDERTRSITRLEAERRRRGWSQTVLAARVGLTPADISRYERGWTRPYPGQAARLAVVLGVPADKLTEVVARTVGLAGTSGGVAKVTPTVERVRAGDAAAGNRAARATASETKKKRSRREE